MVVFIHGDGSRKQRPALVILDTGDDDIVLVPITSIKRTSKGDFRIKNWKQSGLLLDSWLRLSKITSLSKRELGVKLGTFSDFDKKEVIEIWNRLYKF